MKKGTYNTIKNAIEMHDNIFIFHHIRPDGDCLGSQFGLGELIKLNYPKKKVFYIGDSKGILSFLDFTHYDESKLTEKDFKNSLGIVVDASSSDRLEKKELILSGKISAMARLDHHPNGADIDYKYNWIDASYAAAAEMVGYLAMKAKWKIDAHAAEYIYTGIYTDSGRFFYSDTSKRTFVVAAHLMKYGLNIHKIHQELSGKTMKEIKFHGEVLSNFESKEKVIWYYVKNDVIEKLNLSYEEANQVNILANIEDNRIWIFFIDQPDGEIRVRLRSNGPKVNLIGREYGGGGHDNASGAMISDPALIPEIVEKAIKLIKDFENENR
ncbi:DHH family phosphoesterase [Mesomycoplasma lagogenitalium]|uniref:Bifunctional oligoribonuclease/PAP phosphatase NrnA n=1 Tax=Mesomycoplasma lagogenitalium TaxID=171286 RepID=A0ABY8LU23_9BACT|nr:bifunctional oligoribonuclease/PAP phosphatase NrnA [Mesomycoplasma lagogenitalium]WGI36740.1 bifunctional oligoribonuclease/PAP phosphatase NrnA [Mesomycoplasma lagogenitalium]